MPARRGAPTGRPLRRTRGAALMPVAFALGACFSFHPLAPPGTPEPGQVVNVRYLGPDSVARDRDDDHGAERSVTGRVLDWRADVAVLEVVHAAPEARPGAGRPYLPPDTLVIPVPRIQAIERRQLDRARTARAAALGIIGGAVLIRTLVFWVRDASRSPPDPF